MYTLLAGILAAAELQGDLHVVGEDVVEVLHPPVQGVPVSPVGDAVIEEPPAMVTQWSRASDNVHWPPGAHTLVQHGLMIGRVCRGQVLEERVVRSRVDACVHWFTLGHKHSQCPQML